MDSMLIVNELVAAAVSYFRIIIAVMPTVCHSGNGMEMTAIMGVKIMLLLLMLVLLRENSFLEMDF